MRSIWKTKKKFEIKVAGQNLFLISFEDENDLETVMEGSPWLFRKKVVIFERFYGPMDRNKVCLVYSPFWLKIGPCPSKCDKKDLMHALVQLLVDFNDRRLRATIVDCKLF